MDLVLNSTVFAALALKAEGGCYLLLSVEVSILTVFMVVLVFCLLDLKKSGIMFLLEGTTVKIRKNTTLFYEEEKLFTKRHGKLKGFSCFLHFLKSETPKNERREC